MSVEFVFFKAWINMNMSVLEISCYTVYIWSYLVWSKMKYQQWETQKILHQQIRNRNQDIILDKVVNV